MGRASRGLDTPCPRRSRVWKPVTRITNDGEGNMPFHLGKTKKKPRKRAKPKGRKKTAKKTTTRKRRR